jgi:hypothetical protein
MLGPPRSSKVAGRAVCADAGFAALQPVRAVGSQFVCQLEARNPIHSLFRCQQHARAGLSHHDIFLLNGPEVAWVDESFEWSAAHRGLQTFWEETS